VKVVHTENAYDINLHSVCRTADADTCFVWHNEVVWTYTCQFNVGTTKCLDRSVQLTRCNVRLQWAYAEHQQLCTASKYGRQAVLHWHWHESCYEAACDQLLNQWTGWHVSLTYGHSFLQVLINCWWWSSLQVGSIKMIAKGKIVSRCCKQWPHKHIGRAAAVTCCELWYSIYTPLRKEK